jgi:hypothetical protein
MDVQIFLSQTIFSFWNYRSKPSQYSCFLYSSGTDRLFQPFYRPLFPFRKPMSA